MTEEQPVGAREIDGFLEEGLVGDGAGGVVGVVEPEQFGAVGDLVGHGG